VGPHESALCIFCLDYWHVMKSDVKQVFTAPADWGLPTWRAVATKALVVAGTMARLDGSARRLVDHHRTATTDRIANDFMPFGREYAAYVVGGFLLAGNLAHKSRAKAVAVDGLTTTAIAAGLIVPSIKVIVGRSRPRDEQGVHDFHPFNGGYSFPSGHATAAFSVATSVADHYDAFWVKGLAYGLATMVAYSRMEKDAHYLSDVTAGAMIGIGVGHAVRGFNKHGRGQIALGPAGGGLTPDARGLSLSLEFAIR
jgi:membrane-associated phospholipid phosphatase